MNELEKVMDIMGKNKWVVRKDVRPSRDQSVPGFTAARPVIGIAKSERDSFSLDIPDKLSLVIHLADIDRELYCFYEVELNGDELSLVKPYVVKSQDMISAINVFNHLYSDVFLEVLRIEQVYTRYGDIITMNEDGEYVVGYDKRGCSTNLVDLADIFNHANWNIRFHPIFFGLHDEEISNNVLAIGRTDTNNFVAVTGVELRNTRLVCNILLVNPFGLATDICIIPEACDSVDYIVSMYNKLESMKFGTIKEIITKETAMSDAPLESIKF